WTHEATAVICIGSCHTQASHVDGEIPPVTTTRSADPTVSCASAVAPADNTSVTAPDNCNGTVTVTHDADQITPGSCDNRYTIARTEEPRVWKGNTSRHTPNNTVEEETTPVSKRYPADT